MVTQKPLNQSSTLFGESWSIGAFAELFTSLWKATRQGMRFLVLSGLLWAACGCTITESWVFSHNALSSPPTGKITTIATKWESQIFSAPNITQQGEPGPCLAGRLYLFGSNIDHPLAGEGTVKVDMLVEGMIAPDGKPVAVKGCGRKIVWESWNLPPEVLQAGLRRDIIGWGYTILLPWGSYQPDIHKVELVVTYTPKEGIPMFSRTTVQLQHEQREFIVTKELQTARPQ